MPNTPIRMNKLRQIIRLYCQGTGTKRIHGMLAVSRNTIKKYIRVWHSLGISYEEFSAKSDGELSVLFATPRCPHIQSAKDAPAACPIARCMQEAEKEGGYP